MVQTIAVVVFSNLVVYYYLSTVEALQNPILSDNFGLTIKYTSYIFTATLAASIAAPPVT